jgi:hypothetical protein
MARWLAVVVVLVNGLAWWWLDTQRGTHPTPPSKVDSLAATTAAIPKLLLLREVTPEPNAPPTVDAAPESGTFAERPLPGEPTDFEGPPIPATAPTEPAEVDPAATKVATPERAADDTSRPECLVLGGNVDRAQLNAWRDQLRLTGLKVADAISTTRQEVVSGYRVYLPVDRNPGNQMAALRGAGIEALIVAEPNAAQRISAGVFGVRTNALRRQQQLADLGYAAQIVAIRRPRISLWVEVRGPNGLSDRVAKLLNREPLDAQAAAWHPCTATPGSSGETAIPARQM